MTAHAHADRRDFARVDSIVHLVAANAANAATFAASRAARSKCLYSRRICETIVATRSSDVDEFVVGEFIVRVPLSVWAYRGRCAAAVRRSAWCRCERADRHRTDILCRCVRSARAPLRRSRRHLCGSAYRAPSWSCKICAEIGTGPRCTSAVHALPARSDASRARGGPRATGSATV